MPTPMHARLKASVHPPATARLKEAQAATYGSLVEAGGNASLHKEAAKGDADAIRALVAAGADVNAPDKMDATPLVWAAIGGHVGAIRALIEAGAEVNARPNTIDPPLHFAALHDNAEAIRALVEAGAEVNAKVGRGTAALHLASGAGGADAALALIEAGNGTTNVNVKGPSDSTPLHDAATHNNAAAIRVLADAGGDVDARENGCNAAPLHWAAQWCHVEAVRALIEAGAEVNARSSLGATPLGIAIGVGWPEGSSPCEVSAGGSRQPLPSFNGISTMRIRITLAVAFVTEFVVTDAKAEGKDGDPPLYWSDVDARDKSGNTNLHHEAKSGEKPPRWMAAVTVHARNKFAETPLHFALWGPQDTDAVHILRNGGGRE